MSWYYALERVQHGPVEVSHLMGLFNQGVIKKDTLVWCEGMENWAPFGQVKEKIAASTENSLSEDTEKCGVSGVVMPKSEMVRYGDTYIAPQHKDTFVQSLKESGEAASKNFAYAGFWIRLAAFVIDHIILMIPNFLILFLMVIVIAAFNPQFGEGIEEGVDPLMNLLFLVLMLVLWVIPFVYYTLMVGKYGATLGKMAVGIKIVNADGSRVSYFKALGRFFSQLVSAMILYIGYIMAAFHPEKCTLHDLICSTRVIKK